MSLLSLSKLLRQSCRVALYLSVLSGLSLFFVSGSVMANVDTVSQSFSHQVAMAASDLPLPGVQIDMNNLSQYKAFVEPLLAKLIAEDKLKIKIGESASFPVHPDYVAATNQYAENVSLGEQPGELNHYIAGRPFPEILEIDPRAGEKIAWNMRYAYAPDENEVEKFYWQYRDLRTGKIERNLAMYGRMMRFKHRHTTEPKPDLPQNPAEIYNALYLRVNKPPDIANTQLLIHRQEDDTRKEQVWMYHASQRRVRRLASGQTTDAFLGSDIMIEDFLGFNGRIMDMEWHYQGVKWLLLPFYRHTELPFTGEAIEEDNFELVDFGGQGNCFPNVTWQLRKAYVLDAVPLNPNHPLSRRTFYVDVQTASPALIKIYDRADRLWKLSIAGISDSRYHHPNNLDWQGAIAEVVSMIDLQAEHCTTLQLLPRIPDKAFRINAFNVQYLRASGR
ncbi:MAG: DUF1329 domain-containing protein [Pseudomonadales bacterium]|nr:DUF1329 domain-containing protein [Pseudomonadales bacterium]